jgi:hypothetical protein
VLGNSSQQGVHIVARTSYVVAMNKNELKRFLLKGGSLKVWADKLILSTYQVMEGRTNFWFVDVKKLLREASNVSKILHEGIMGDELAIIESIKMEDNSMTFRWQRTSSVPNQLPGRAQRAFLIARRNFRILED